MNEYFDKKFNKKVVYIAPGEYYSTDNDIIIQTLLGSCISVCLFSDVTNFVGMNHFMLPTTSDVDNFTLTSSGRYGMYAMEVLINSFLKKGIKKKMLKAKVFGGGNVIEVTRLHDGIASNNIKFIINYLDKENIPILSSHLGGSKARKILFFTHSKKVLLKEISESETRLAVRDEKKYQTKIVKEEKKHNNIFLFD